MSLGPVEHPPSAWGPFAVGTREYLWRDASRAEPFGRAVTTRVWYPADAGCDEPVVYLAIMPGIACADAPPARGDGPYPLVMFSHGNKGIPFQSYSLTAWLASHGFVVVAPTHEGNTIFDNPDDAQLATVAMARPHDVAFALEQVRALPDDDPLAGVADVDRLAVAGHSFGGHTTLVAAGGVIDVDAALARCEAGVDNDVFCDSLQHWPRGQVVEPPPFEGLRAALALAPGGYSSFGDEGLASVQVPTMVMGGTLDEFTAADLRPIYEALDPPRFRIEIEGMGHMGFTDICRLPIVPAIPALAEMCDPAVFLPVDRGFEVVNPFATAFLRRYLYDDPRMDAWLAQDYADTVPESALTTD